MIDVENRVPTPGQEGRVLITPEGGGAPYYATIQMADTPLADGTPWSRQTGRLLQADIRNYPISAGQTIQAGDVVDVVNGEIVGNRKQLSEYSVGDIVQVNENGSPVNYIVVNQGIPGNSPLYDSSCDGTWLLRYDIYSNAAWDAENSNVLPGADIFITMADMLSMYDAGVQAAIKTVKIPYCVGGGSSTVQSGANGLECRIFPLCGYEVGLTMSPFPIDGKKLDYFEFGIDSTAEKKRIAQYTGVSATWFLRSATTENSTNAMTVTPSGSNGISSVTSELGIRPAFVLPGTFYAAGLKNTNTQAVALQSGTAGQSIDIIYSGIVFADFISAGQTIVSGGVYGAGVLDGVLQVWSKDRPGAVFGSFTANTTSKTSVNLGFRPSAVILYNAKNNNAPVGFYTGDYNGYASAAMFPRVYTKAYTAGDGGGITDTGFDFKGSIYTGGSSTQTVFYVAWR